MRVGGSQPAISVVMPLYNKERDVARAIRSALAQTFTDFELIVVNDGSTDLSVEAVATFNDPRIQLVHQENKGVSEARNRGVSEARAELVAFLDADDEWLPEFLATVWHLSICQPDSAAFATGYLLREPVGRTRPARVRGLSPGFTEGVLEDYFSVAAISDPPLCSSAVTVKREALQCIGGFPTGIRSGEDLLTWARLAVRYPIAYSVEPLAIFWMPGYVTDRPGRFAEQRDGVGDGLIELLSVIDNNRLKSLRVYVALWYRMRSVIALQLGRRLEALRNAVRSMKYGGWNSRLMMVGLLALAPCPNPGKILLGLRRMRDNFLLDRQVGEG